MNKAGGVNKLKIDYPCDWSFKVIGSDPLLIKESIEDDFKGFDYNLCESKKSSKGNYTSFNLSLTVESELQRNRFFQILKETPTVKFVI